MGAPREGRTCAKGVGRGERRKGKSVPSPGPQQAKEAREGRGQGVCRIRAHRWEAPAAEGAAANPPTLVRQPDRGATHKKGRQKQGAGACYGSRLSTRYARRAAQMKETRGRHDQSKKHKSNHTHSVERHRDTRAQLERHDGRVLKKEMKKERRTATTVDPRRANDTGRGQGSNGGALCCRLAYCRIRCWHSAPYSRRDILDQKRLTRCPHPA